MYEEALRSGEFSQQSAAARLVPTGAADDVLAAPNASILRRVRDTASDSTDTSIMSSYYESISRVFKRQEMRGQFDAELRVWSQRCDIQTMRRSVADCQRSDSGENDGEDMNVILKATAP